MPPQAIRILHISDFHARGSRDKEPWRRRRVLGDAWERNLDEMVGDHPVDLVLFTGDAADWGQVEEYKAFQEFVEHLLSKLKLSKERFFPVPGNHDINRKVHDDARLKALELAEKDPRALSRWMAGQHAKGELDSKLRKNLLARQDNYRHWLRSLLNRPDLDPAKNPHGSLGYRCTLMEWGFPLHIIGLDSSWLCGEEKEKGKLRLSENQIQTLARDERGDFLKDVRLAIMHHPLSDLADGDDSEHKLGETVDLLLRGHLHETKVEIRTDPDRTLTHLAAGCLYEGELEDRYANACQMITLNVNKNGELQDSETHFRAFSPRGHWHNDDSLYANSRNGILKLSFRPKPTRIPAHNPYNYIDTDSLAGFIGRKSQLTSLEKAIMDKQSVNLIGDWRIGKTYLLKVWHDKQSGLGREIALLDGQNGEGASIAAFVRKITGYKVKNNPDNAADALSNWLETKTSPPLILVDEFGKMVEQFDPRFIVRLRGMMTSKKILFVLGTSKPLTEIYQDKGLTSPFQNMLSNVPLGLLDDHAAETLADRGGFPSQQKALMVEWAGNHPYYLQLMGNLLFESIQTGKTQQWVLDRFCFTSFARLMETWNTLGKKDKKALEGLLKGKPVERRGLRIRGLVTTQNEPFGKVLTEFLREVV